MRSCLDGGQQWSQWGAPARGHQASSEQCCCPIGRHGAYQTQVMIHATTGGHLLRIQLDFRLFVYHQVGRLATCERASECLCACFWLPRLERLSHKHMRLVDQASSGSLLMARERLLKCCWLAGLDGVCVWRLMWPVQVVPDSR